MKLIMCNCLVNRIVTNERFHHSSCGKVDSPLLSSCSESDRYPPHSNANSNYLSTPLSSRSKPALPNILLYLSSLS